GGRFFEQCSGLRRLSWPGVPDELLRQCVSCRSRCSHHSTTDCSRERNGVGGATSAGGKEYRVFALEGPIVSSGSTAQWPGWGIVRGRRPGEQRAWPDLSNTARKFQTFETATARQGQDLRSR